jgi:hypothetical protein
VYNNTLATVKRQIQQAENPTPAVVISVEAVYVNNAIRLDYLTSEVSLVEPEIGRTVSNIPIDNNCTDDGQHFRMPGCSGDFADESDGSDAIPTARQRRRAATELDRFHLGTSDVDGYEGEAGDDAVADKEEEASQAEDESMQNEED